MLRKSKSLTRKIGELRSSFGAPFFIRGTQRRYVETKKKQGVAERKVQPHYMVLPDYKMGSKEWISRLHATIHATTARAMMHGGRNAFAIQLNHYLIDGKRLDPRLLPSVSSSLIAMPLTLFSIQLSE